MFAETFNLGITQVWFPSTSDIPQGYTYDVYYWNVGSGGCEGPAYKVSTPW